MNAIPFLTIRCRKISCDTPDVSHESWTWFVRKWLRILVLPCLCVAFSVSLLPAEDEPFLATVVNPNAVLRSGPGDDYYATNHIAAGQMLEVYYIIDDIWCAVRPPMGSFTWVDARNVRLDKNQIGEVLINGVSARVGSELSNSCGAVQVVLDRGEKVFVFERIETPNDIDTPVWYKIAPPAGEFRFIRLAELQFDNNIDDTQDNIETQSPILLVSGVQPQEQTSRPSSSQLSKVVVPPGSLPMPGASRNSDGTVSNQAVRIAANTRANTADPQPVASADPGIDSDDFREVLGQLKLDLADALLGQETANETMQSLGHQARMLHQTAPNPNDRAEAYQLIVGIERATRVRRHEAGQNRSGDTTSPTTVQEDTRYDSRVMQLPDNSNTNVPEPPPQTPLLRQPSRSTTPGTKSTGTPQRLALPRLEMTDTPAINTTPEPNYAEPIEQYSAPGSFFDRSGRHVAAQDNTGQYANPSAGHYSGQQDFEIYLDQNGRYTDASGHILDGQTLGAILQGADVVLMYDPRTGGYQQVSQHQMQSGQFPGTDRQPDVPQKSWLQRLINGELFQSDTPQSQQYDHSQYGTSPFGSGYAPYTYQSAYGNHGYAPPQQQQQPTKQGMFYTSQPSLIAQQPRRNHNAMPGRYPNNDPPRGWQGRQQAPQQGQGVFPNMIPQEITLPDGVQVPGEMVVYDESQGINLLGNTQNVPQQDQLALLLQQMAAPTMTPVTDTIPIINPQSGYGASQSNLPMTEAESNMRTFQLRSARQEELPNRNANHQVTGRLENGVGRVSKDAFDAIGKLGRVRNASDDMSQYALVDAGGKTICLVTPTPGVELSPYIGQTIGVTGIRGNYVHEGETFRHISAKAVYPVQVASGAVQNAESRVQR